MIRSESRTVLVDAVAVDKKGRFATDLTARDFTIREDGREQKITGFSLESSGVSPERPSRHYIAMLFATSAASQASQMIARQEASRFVDGFASPDRYMAILSYSLDGGMRIPQNFTTEHDLLKKALSAMQNSSGAASSSAPAAAQRGRNAGGATGSAPAADSFAYRDMLASLRSLAASLANIRGRKALVLFTTGMAGGGDVLTDLAATVDACNKANVAVYTVGSGAAVTAGNPAAGNSDAPPAMGRGSRGAPMPELATDDRNLPTVLSEGTGGVAFLNSNDLAASLGKVAQEQDQYYLLSYTPTVDSAEGSCHELKVKVDRGDLEVRARKSYCTSKPADLLSGKPAGRDLETRAAAGGPGNITAKMQLPWFYIAPDAAPNVARVNLAMEIVPSAMKFRKEKGGKLHGEFNLAGVAWKSDGTAAARVSDIVKIDLDNQQQVDAFLRAPYHYENQFEIAPGQYNFRMAFSSGSADTQGFGKVEMPLNVDPWNGQTLAISALALSHDAHPATDLAAGLDVSLLEGPRPLVAKGAELVPSGTSQFHSGEPAFFYFEAYEPLLTTAKPDAPLPAIGVRVRVLDRATGRQKSDTGAKSALSFEHAGNPAVPVISSLPIANLPAGTFKLEVSVMREAGDPVIRTADFEVLPNRD
jgi:VWFA-related protein